MLAVRRETEKSGSLLLNIRAEGPEKKF